MAQRDIKINVLARLTTKDEIHWNAI